MNSTNHRCNAFQILVGIFTHSCGTPETVQEFLAHAGLSVLTTTINEAINNLAKESNQCMQKHGKTLLTLYSYDNLDIDLKHSTPSFENHSATLIHLTSATMLPLSHRASIHDLKCSDELHNQLRANPDSSPLDSFLKKSIWTQQGTLLNSGEGNTSMPGNSCMISCILGQRYSTDFRSG